MLARSWLPTARIRRFRLPFPMLSQPDAKCAHTPAQPAWANRRGVDHRPARRDGGWEQFLPILVGGKGPRLAHQRPDDMVVINAVLLFAHQTWQGKHRRGAQISFQRFRTDTDQHT